MALIPSIPICLNRPETQEPPVSPLTEGARVSATCCHTLLDDGPVTTPMISMSPCCQPTCTYAQVRLPSCCQTGTFYTSLRHYIVFLFPSQGLQSANVPLSYRASLLFSPLGNFRQHVDTWLHHTSYKNSLDFHSLQRQAPLPLPLRASPTRAASVRRLQLLSHALLNHSAGASWPKLLC